MEIRPSLPKLALGALNMITWAISDHRRRFYNVMPRRIELHYGSEPDIVAELAEKYGYHRPAVGDIVFRDVTIVFSRYVEYPALINCNGDTEYL